MLEFRRIPYNGISLNFLRIPNQSWWIRIISLDWFLFLFFTRMNQPHLGYKMIPLHWNLRRKDELVKKREIRILEKRGRVRIFLQSFSLPSNWGFYSIFSLCDCIITMIGYLPIYSLRLLVTNQSPTNLI